MPTPTQSQPRAAGQAAHTPLMPALEMRGQSGGLGYEIGFRIRTEFRPMEGGGTRMLSIADPNGPYWNVVAVIPGMGNSAELREQAAFIIRACNSHAELIAWKDAAIVRSDKLHAKVAALVEAHDTVARTLGVISTNITILGGQLSERDDKKFGAWLLTLQAEVNHALDASRAALSLAKEGTP